MCAARSRPLSVRGISVLLVCAPDKLHSVSPCRISQSRIFWSDMSSLHSHNELTAAMLNARHRIRSLNAAELWYSRTCSNSFRSVAEPTFSASSSPKISQTKTVREVLATNRPQLRLMPLSQSSRGTIKSDAEELFVEYGVVVLRRQSNRNCAQLSTGV